MKGRIANKDFADSTFSSDVILGSYSETLQIFIKQIWNINEQCYAVKMYNMVIKKKYESIKEGRIVL